ncbi:MAG TPA: Uma2 family endonuclease [Thermoanaerobaculia bacterium]
MGEPATRLTPPEEWPNDDPFRLGWRLKSVRLPDGSSEIREVPLTAEDLLDPQVGDHVTQNSWHISTAHQLLGILQARYKSQPDVLVTCDMKIIWGIAGLESPSPDLAIIPGVRDRGRFRRSFRVKRERAQPVLVVELVSDEPEHKSADHDKKVKIYQRAGVPEYVIADPPYTPSGCRLTGYRLNRAGRYEPIPPDSQGRILSVTTSLGFAPAGETIDLIDAETGERLLTDSEARKRLEEENAKLRAELERLRNSKS